MSGPNDRMHVHTLVKVPRSRAGEEMQTGMGIWQLLLRAGPAEWPPPAARLVEESAHGETPAEAPAQAGRCGTGWKLARPAHGLS